MSPRVIYRLPIVPVGAVRLSRRDFFKPSPQAQRYFTFKDELRDMARRREYVVPASGLSLRFVLPMPASWSKRKRAEMRGQPHQQKPDTDNMIKGFKDALCEDDSYVWLYGPMMKVWGDEGAIEILEYAPAGLIIEAV